MNSVILSLLFACLVKAHSAVWTVTFDGNTYPARDARIDPYLNAKRVEWSFQNAYNFTWHAITDVLEPGFACGAEPQAPALKAVARAGSNVTVQWSGIIKMHNGPVMSYLGALPTADTKPQDVKFFKIAELGYDKQAGMWANEKLIQNNFADTFQLPSDIKPGMYILRTELLALHGNRRDSNPSENSGPQFYNHCFNVEIKGNGNAVPEGVKFPGAYKRDDEGIKFNLYTNKADSYIIPGPPKYNGKYEAPSGPKSVVSGAEKGEFSIPEFEAKYKAYKKKQDEYALTANAYFNQPASGKGGNPAEFMAGHKVQGKQLDKELSDLREEAIKLGIASPETPKVGTTKSSLDL